MFIFQVQHSDRLLFSKNEIKNKNKVRYAPVLKIQSKILWKFLNRIFHFSEILIDFAVHLKSEKHNMSV